MQNKSYENEQIVNKDIGLPTTSLNINTNVILSFDGDVNAFIERRKHKGMNQSKIAEVLGYSNTSVIGHFESGAKGLNNHGYTLFRLVTDTHPEYVLIPNKDSSAELLVDVPDGEAIRKMRLNVNGMSQQAMAKVLGLTSKTLVSNYENNRKRPSVQNWVVFLLITNQHPTHSLKPLLNKVG